MKAARLLIRFVSNLNDRGGRVTCLLIFPMVFIISYETLVRYVFNSPTIWAHEITGFLFCVYVMLGGAYALQQRGHIRIDILYRCLSLRVRAIVDLFTWTLFYLFCGILLWTSGEGAWTAIVRVEHSWTIFAPPIWPVKTAIVLGVFLMLLQGLAKTVNDILIVQKGAEP